MSTLWFNCWKGKPLFFFLFIYYIFIIYNADFIGTGRSASLSLSAIWLQVDPDVFAALPKELQEELKSAYNGVTNVQPQAKMCMSQIMIYVVAWSM